MNRLRVWLLIGGAAGVLLIGILLAGPPPSPGSSPLSSRRPDGFLALVTFLGEMGLEVRASDAPPGPLGTFVLLADLRDGAQHASLLEWAERGGRLVVADPESLLLPRLGVSAVDRIGGILGSRRVAPGCVDPAAVGVRSIVVRVTDFSLNGGGPVASACFPGGDGSFVVEVTRGSGEIVLLGGDSPLTNEFLDKGDNAAFALGLFENDTITFGPPFDPQAGEESPRSIWSLLPGRAKAALVALALAAVAFAFVRARRLGKPRHEAPLSPIPASELVQATGKLYRAARATAHCGRLLREGMSAQLGRRLGLSGRSSPEDLMAVLGGSEDRQRLEELLAGRDPGTDDELIRLGRDLEQLRDRVEGARR